MTVKIELVSHVWAVNHPHYADALCYQLSSILLDPPKECELTVTICLEPDDQKSENILSWFWTQLPDRVISKFLYLPIERLGRRAIGRNIIALQSKADIIWYSDIDQVYKHGVFDRLANLEWPDGAVMIYPRKYHISRDHAIGDKALARVGGKPQVIDIDELEFVEGACNRAIGGIQIIKGDFAREHGYLKDSEKWMAPTGCDHFCRCFCDMAYRGFCRDHGEIKKVDLPGMYRLRHSECSHS